jgi:transposase
MGFRTIPRAGKVSTLHRWIKQALNTGIHAIVCFVRSLKEDMEAAARQPWSNDLWKGQINRLKMLKRQMYGRVGQSCSARDFFLILLPGRRLHHK